MLNIALPSRSNGFSYIEVLIATVVMAVALVPALEALQTGILSTDIQQSRAIQYYQRLQKMAELQAESYGNLLAAAKLAGNQTTATSYSDASGSSNRRLVYIALYDADTNSFTISDPDTDGDSDPYTGSSSNLLWLQVVTEGSLPGFEVLLSR